MPLQSGSFYRPENGRYQGVFVGLKDGPMVTVTKDDGRIVKEPRMLWQFQVYDVQTGQPIVNPMTGESPAVAEGMSSQTTGVSATGTEAKARIWLRALLAAKGLTFNPDGNPNEQAQQALGARVILHFGKGPRGGKDGTLLSIEPPPVSYPGVGAPVPTPPPAPPAPGWVAAPIPVEAPAPVGAMAEIPEADYDAQPVVAVTGL